MSLYLRRNFIPDSNFKGNNTHVSIVVTKIIALHVYTRDRDLFTE